MNFSLQWGERYHKKIPSLRPWYSGWLEHHVYRVHSLFLPQIGTKIAFFKKTPCIKAVHHTPEPAKVTTFMSQRWYYSVQRRI